MLNLIGFQCNESLLSLSLCKQFNAFYSNLITLIVERFEFNMKSQYNSNKKNFSCKITIRQKNELSVLFTFVAIGDYIDLFLWLWVLFFYYIWITMYFRWTFEHLNIFQFSIWNGKNASNVDLPVRWTFEFFPVFILYLYFQVSTPETPSIVVYIACVR